MINVFYLFSNPNHIKLDMVQNKYTGPGSLKLRILTESNVSRKVIVEKC